VPTLLFDVSSVHLSPWSDLLRRPSAIDDCSVTTTPRRCADGMRSVPDSDTLVVAVVVVVATVHDDDLVNALIDTRPSSVVESNRNFERSLRLVALPRR